MHSVIDIYANIKWLLNITLKYLTVLAVAATKTKPFREPNLGAEPLLICISITLENNMLAGVKLMHVDVSYLFIHLTSTLIAQSFGQITHSAPQTHRDRSGSCLLQKDRTDGRIGETVYAVNIVF